MDKSGVLIALMIKSHDHAPPHEQMTIIRLKQAIYDKFVQLREFVESDLEHLRTNLREKRKRVLGEDDKNVLA